MIKLADFDLDFKKLPTGDLLRVKADLVEQLEDLKDGATAPERAFEILEEINGELAKRDEEIEEEFEPEDEADDEDQDD